MEDFILGGPPKSLQMVTAVMNIKKLSLRKKSHDQLSILKSRDITLPTKVQSQGSSREEQPHIQGAVAARTQEGLEELLHIQGQEGQR